MTYMESHSENRREARFQIKAVTSVKVAKSGETVRTTTSDISGGGVLLHFKEPVRFMVGDEVSCECKLPETADGSLPCWTLGKVVRVGDRSAAVEFEAGVFPGRTR